ncbi:Zinc finger-containing protein 2 [Collichthys lucidus]|uniref:Zinc finger-containing protein 2 n=1 Tax=Collichthys lucidus TaxID=240159 RepID=A0A4U5TYC2_COLLU|nr:Zinc finger-containing protein 2 [Collichthys lucidus]
MSDDQRKESPIRTWVESEPGPSRCQPSRQGYCGYCRVLYSNLDQHLSSLKHLDSVRASSRGSSTASSSTSSRTKLTLLERFLQDVLQHHPHQYKDPRPSHADLPSVSTPPLPREELDELCFSDDDSRSLGTREHLPSSDDASMRCQPTNQQEDDTISHKRESAPIREQDGGGSAPAECTHVQTPPHIQTPPPVHRKTNRRKTSGSSSPPHRALNPAPSPCPAPGRSPVLRPGPGLAPTPNPSPPVLEARPWLSWQRERRAAHREEAFSSDHSDPMDQTIEEVIQACCYGVSSTTCQQEETESFHFSLPVSMETQSEDWDSPVQVPSHTAVQVSQVDKQDLSRLMDIQVDLADQVYSYQLDSALHNKRRAVGGVGRDEGFLTLPIDEVLPAPAHIPESFRGKTWAQIEHEDEEKVDRLVQQFRRDRYGRRSQNKKRRGVIKGVEPDTGVLPLLDCDDHDSVFVQRRTGRKGRAFRVASRCQVVKVSHSTQTVRLVVPAVRQSASEAPPSSGPAANQDAAERTPDVQMWRCLPASYSNIVTPLQPRTSLVYLLCSPSGPAPSNTPAPKRCRKKRRPLDLQTLKVKYKQLPVRFYDPTSNRILKNPPKGFLWRRGSTPSCLPPPCVRQLFRSLSPDLNTDRAAGSSRVKGQRSSDTAFSHGNSFLLSTLSRDSAQSVKQDTVRRRRRTTQAPPPSPRSRSERGRGRRSERTRPLMKKTSAQATPPPPRREGLRRAGPGRKVPGSTGPAHPPSPRRSRPGRGRGHERSRR